jgi:ribosomal protein S18 acetylase RimI-like enzyme
MREEDFYQLHMHQKMYKYSSLAHLSHDVYEQVELLRADESLILLRDGSADPPVLHYAANELGLLLEALRDVPGPLALRSVPPEALRRLRKLGFEVWAEYMDFFSQSLSKYQFTTKDVEFLTYHDCFAVAELAEKCQKRTRGFVGESAAWFADWIAENKVLLLREGKRVVGFCCVGFYAEGGLLWVRSLAVDPECRHRGFGSWLLEQALAYGAAGGARRAFLAGDILNKNAVGLYKKYGFLPREESSELHVVRTGHTKNQ